MRAWTLSLSLLVACAAPRASVAPEPPEAVADPSEASASPALVDLERPLAIVFEERVVQLETGSMRVWLYAPKPMPEAPACIIVPPAGSNLISGKKLGEGDRPEHEPYVLAGHVVVAFDIAGEFPDNPSDSQVAEAMQRFQDAEGGVGNARAALTLALESYPAIDRDRLFAAGHSSAGTIALMHAALDDRIDGAIAYAPPSDLIVALGTPTIREIDAGLPGFERFVHANTPSAHLARLSTIPIFLFHAKDDRVVPVEQTQRMIEGMAQPHASTTYVIVEKGDHYQSMISLGIPRAIAWLADLVPATP